METSVWFWYSARANILWIMPPIWKSYSLNMRRFISKENAVVSLFLFLFFSWGHHSLRLCFTYLFKQANESCGHLVPEDGSWWELLFLLSDTTMYHERNRPIWVAFCGVTVGFPVNLACLHHFKHILCSSSYKYLPSSFLFCPKAPYIFVWKHFLFH